MRRWIIAGCCFVLLIAVVQAQQTNARVIRMWEQLNLRVTPERSAAAVATLAGETPLLVTGRSADGKWYYAQTTDGSAGWVAAGYVELLSVTFSQLPVINPAADPAASPAPQEQPAAPAQPAQDTGARVATALLNLRSAPTTAAALLNRLPQGTPVTLIGRSADGLWLRIRVAEGQEGWVFASYIETAQDLNALPLVDTTTTASAAPAAPQGSPDAAPTFFTLGATAWQTFVEGQALGNRRDVFSKVGDSITASEFMYHPFGMGVFELGGFAYLRPTIDFFTRTIARDHNSFANTSLAANNGWTTTTVLSASAANPQNCLPGEAPLVCEYRIVRPAVALIMLGTNDVTLLTPEEYAGNLRTILQLTTAAGVIPVLSTIPPRRGYEPQTAFFNELIVQAAAERGVSLWDYGSVMRTLENDGLSADGVHPSQHPGGFGYAANFTGDSLKYGYVMRNLTALQVLHTLRQQILER